MTDWTQILNRLEPNQDGEQPVRHRSAVVDAVNSDGTVDLDFDGTVIPDVSVLAGAYLFVGAVVQVALWRGDMLVLGANRTSAAGGPLGFLARSLRTADFSTSSTSVVDLGSVAVAVTPPAGRLIRLDLGFPSASHTGADRWIAYITDGSNTVLQARTVRTTGTNAEAGGSFFVTDAPAAGAKTYKARVQKLGSGTLTIGGAPTTPIELLATDIGPA